MQEASKEDPSSRDINTIIYFGNDWGADNRTSSHHIAKRLIRDYNVIYVECPGLRSPQLTKRDILKIFKKVFHIFRKKRTIDDSSFVKTLYQIPFHGLPFMGYLNKKVIIWQVKKLYKDNSLTSPILWFVIPHVSYVIDEMENISSVYYCVDDYSELPGVNKKQIRKLDDKISYKCKLLFVTSEPLLEKKKSYGNKVHLSKHGVDFEHFNSAINKGLVVPSPVKNIPKPIIGFFGLIEEWVDLGLIEALAIKKPEWNFLMIGRVAVDNSSVNSLSNVYFIGSVEYNKLPAYAQSFDVGLIPVKTNELIRNFNPLKLREYLAMGIPIVSVDFPELGEFGDSVYVARTEEEFMGMITKALKDNTHELELSRASLVESSSWENRYNNVISKVQDSIAP